MEPKNKKHKLEKEEEGYSYDILYKAENEYVVVESDTEIKDRVLDDGKIEIKGKDLYIDIKNIPDNKSYIIKADGKINFNSSFDNDPIEEFIFEDSNVGKDLKISGYKKLILKNSKISGNVINLGSKYFDEVTLEIYPDVEIGGDIIAFDRVKWGAYRRPPQRA